MRKGSQLPLLIAAIVLAAAAIATYAAGMRAVAQWLLLAGAIFALLYIVVRRAAKAQDGPRQPDAPLFGQPTTMEAPLETPRGDSHHRK